jgi:hypothetical protein
MWFCEACEARNWDEAETCYKCKMPKSDGNRALTERRDAERKHAQAETERTHDVTRLLERLEAFEDRAGVRLDALYAVLDGGRVWRVGNIDYPCVRVNGELHPHDGVSLAESVTIIADAYDVDGRLVRREATLPFDPKSFFGYETFSLEVVCGPIKRIAKIRIYPKLGWRG